MPRNDLQLRADLIHVRDLSRPDNPPNPIDPEYQWHFLAEGDSWFTIGAIPSSNLLFELRLAHWTRILTIAYPGDTIIHMGDIAANKDLRKVLAKPNFNYPFHALLLSGGGNDVIDAAASIIRPERGSQQPEDHIDQAALQAKLDEILDSYAQIVALRDSAKSKSQGRPIFVHTYDYPTPRNAPATFVGTISLLGPWLYPAFQNSGLDIALQQRIVNRVMDALAEALLSLDSERGDPAKRLPAFHVIDTRNTLVQANPTEVGNSNDWLNEIHPNHDGYRKIADKLSAGINAVLLG
ncbi:MAG: hypothetical protein IV110_05835 [Aquabacterium sp.]|uniref:hypothetical protein n=1 Tax=Aquabacterium sp. TaxID=1872578 RepID=UPI001D59C5A8|nr:hypothetical protein [Aquabacterium sp.]MBT9609545.1 hypothetical protein [Aquabacterium sp.]